MFARTFWNAKSTRERMRKARRKSRPTIEQLETLQLMSVLDSISGAFQTLGNDIENTAVQVGNGIVYAAEQTVNVFQQAESAVVGAVQNVVNSVANYGDQVISNVANEATQIGNAVSMGLGQATSVFTNVFSQGASTLNTAVSTITTDVQKDVASVTGQVTSEIQTAIMDVANAGSSGLAAAQNDINSALSTATTSLTSSFQTVGSSLASAFTNPAVEAGLAYSLDGVLVLGGVALMATSVIDGPAGDIAGATLIGAGVAGIEYTAENTSSSGAVSGGFSWSNYGENLGIGGATGLLGGATGAGTAALGAQLGGSIAATAVAGATGGAVNGLLNQVLTNAVNGQAIGNNLGEAAGLGALEGGVLGGLSKLASQQSASFVSDAKSALSSGTSQATDTFSLFGTNLSKMGLTMAGKDLLGDSLKATLNALGGGAAIASDGKTLASTLGGMAYSDIQDVAGMGTTSGSMAVNPQMIVNDLNAVFAASPSQGSTSYVQSVTSVPLPFGSGTALVGIGNDNNVYVDEIVPGTGSTGWISQYGPAIPSASDIAVTTTSAGLPAIFAIGIDNAVHYDQQNADGTWSGWSSLSDGGAIFQSIVATQSVNGTPEVFGIGFDNAVYTQSQNTDGSWSGWTDLYGTVSQIAATSNDGLVSVFAIGGGNLVYADQISNGGSWTTWYNLNPADTFKQIAAGTSFPNYGPEIWGIGFNNAVYTESESAGVWSGFQDMGGNVKSITTSPDEPSAVYAIDDTNHVSVDMYKVTGPGNNEHAAWTGFQEQGTQGFKQVTAGGGQMYGLGADGHVYAINPTGTNTDVGDYTSSMAANSFSFTLTNGNISMTTMYANGTTSVWPFAGNWVPMLSMAPVTNADSVTVFAIGADHQGYYDYMPKNGTNTGWRALGGVVNDYQSIVSTTGPNGQPEVFVIGNDNAVWTATINSDGTSAGFSSLGGQVRSLSVAQDPSGGAVVAAIALNGYAAYVNEQRADGSFAGWTFTGGLVKSLTAVQAPDGGVALVAIGMDNAVWVDEQSFTAAEAGYGTIDSSWTGFYSLGGSVTSVTAFDNGFGSLEILTQDTAGTQSTNTQTPNGWTGFQVVTA
jgi:hypothetical protein